jgi:hypothetical protein
VAEVSPEEGLLEIRLGGEYFAWTFAELGDAADLEFRYPA